ncbi:MAG: pyridoxine 5'-phosphate synthase [Balneolaceae bacterium]
MQLLVNIDHVATLRNARGEGYPDPVEAAKVCENAGASGIVFHLRGDRRHIRDQDVYRLKKTVKGVFDFEMAASSEMVDICIDVNPDLATLVPENRAELTTEGGLHMKNIFEDYRDRVIPALREQQIAVSLFLDPVPDDIKLAARLGVEAVELHTGQFANARNQKDRIAELERLVTAAGLVHSLGMKVNAGHGLNLKNLGQLVKAVPHLNDVSIGHALISEALFTGLDKAVGSYLDILNCTDRNE